MRCNDFIQLISRHEWEPAKVEIQGDPVTIRGSAVVRGFLGSHSDCQVTPMHIACAHGAPLHFLEILKALDTQFLRTRDSVYKRIPPPAALISSAPSKIILQLIDWDPSSVQAQDILGRYPLHYACNHGASIEEVEPFGERRSTGHRREGGLEWMVADPCGMPLTVIRLLLMVCPGSIPKTTFKGTTPLTHARRTKDQSLINVVESMIHDENRP